MRTSLTIVEVETLDRLEKEPQTIWANSPTRVVYMNLVEKGLAVASTNGVTDATIYTITDEGRREITGVKGRSGP
jgi:DNA-binding PadR family transcriptional regulator